MAAWNGSGNEIVSNFTSETTAMSENVGASGGNDVASSAVGNNWSLNCGRKGAVTSSTGKMQGDRRLNIGLAAIAQAVFKAASSELRITAM
jgi:hypothetical protein